MNLIEFFLKKPIFTIVLMFVLIFGGITAATRLRMESTPEVKTPVIYVAVPLPGAAPEEVESLITNPLEDRIGELEDIDRIKSTSVQNVGIVVVFFKDGVKPEEKFKEFREKVAEVKPQLPKESMEPIIEEISFENLPMMFLGFSNSGSGQYETSRYASRIRKQLQAVPGVKKVVMTGATEKQAQIQMSPEGLKKYGPGALKTLTQKLDNINTNFPGGKVKLYGQEYTVRTVGKFESLEDLGNMVVGMSGGQPVHLNQVAKISMGYPDPSTFVRLDGKPGVTLAIMKKRGYGTTDVADRVKEVLKKYDNIVIMSDSSDTIRKQMGDLRIHALWGILLVLIVLFIALGFRVAAIVSFAIPMTVLMTFMAMASKDMTLDIVSLFALLLALGMMVDNSIVVCENIYRHMSMGKSSFQAAKDATAEVGWPILSSTGAVIAAFLPIGIFLTGPIGEFTRPIPIVVTFALISSLIVANFLNPVLCDLFLKDVKKEEDRDPKSAGERAKRFYARVVGWCLDHGKLVMAGAMLLLVGCVLLVVFKVIGLQVFPQLDTAKFYIEVKLPPGSDIEKTTANVEKIEKIFRESGYVKHYIANIGSSGPRIEIDDNTYFGSNIARLIVDLKPVTEINKSHKEVLQQFRRQMKKLFVDGTQAAFIEKILGPPVGAPINIQVSGQDYEKMRVLTEEIKKLLDKQPGVADLKDNMPGTVPQIVLRANQDTLGRLDLTTRDLGGFIFLTLTGYDIGKISVCGESVPLFLKIKAGSQEDVSAMQGATFSLPDGTSLALSDLLISTFQDGLSGIEHEGQKRTVTIEANLAPGFEAKRIIDAVKLKIPPMQAKLIAKDPQMKNVGIRFGGETMLIGQAFNNLLTAIIVSIILIYLILLIEFRSTTQPLIILVCVPYALVGVILGLLIMHYSFSILAGIGLLCLIGIVVNNGIIYIDYANLLQERGMALKEACLQACMTRVRPIILTKSTVILGIIPMAMASASRTQFWKPLCWAIIWGLVIATTLTLVIIPVAYYIIEGWRGRYYCNHPRRAPKSAKPESCTASNAPDASE
ncbi:MAG: efflux RND transporter permease subunit [bacterium]